MPNVLQTALIVLVLLLALLSLGSWVVWYVHRLMHRPWIAYRPRLPVPWSGGDVLLLILTFLALVAFGLSAVSVLYALPAAPSTVVAQVDGHEHGEITSPDEPLAAPPRRNSAATVATLSIAHLVWMAIALFYLATVTGALADDLGFLMDDFQTDLMAGVKVFLPALLPVYGVQLALTQFWESKHPLAELAREEQTLTIMIIATVSAVVVAPLVEEFLFRVLLQGWLEKRVVAWRSETGIENATPGAGPIIIVSVVFALLHAGHGPDPVALFVLSLFLGYAYRQTHRIYASWLTHVAVNGMATLGLWSEYLGS